MFLLTYGHQLHVTYLRYMKCHRKLPASLKPEISEVHRTVRTIAHIHVFTYDVFNSDFFINSRASADVVTGSNAYGQGTGSILMDDVSCAGSELDISQCSHRGWHIHNCYHTEDVSVDCGEGMRRSTVSIVHSSLQNVEK